MSMGNSWQTYLCASRDEPSLGITSGLRPEPTIDEARAELSEAIIRVATNVSHERYGSFFGAVSRPAVNEFLKGIEFKLSQAKGDLTIVFEELLDRFISKNQQN